MATAEGSLHVNATWCPSAQPDWEDSVAIGVVEGTVEKPRLVHFGRALPVNQKLLALANPVTPTEVFRFAAPCAQARCVHFQKSLCNLVTQIVEVLPSMTDTLPACSIRAQCRWWLQEGKPACLRCGQVVTDNPSPSQEMRIAVLASAGQDTGT